MRDVLVEYPFVFAPPPPTPPGPPPKAASAPVSVPPRVPPAVVDPAHWEDFPVFRETFLMYLTLPPYADALRTVGDLLFTLVLECYGQWPAWPESTTRTELRAALADVRHLEGFLTSVGREHEASSLTFEDAALSQFAARQAHELARIADRIADELGEWTP
jgi:hypothetical protein